MNQLQLNLQKQNLFKKDEPILLAVSAGIDSIVLAHLLHSDDFQFGIAHCNFQLRADASTKDEQFVMELSERYNVPFYCKRFETEEYAKAKKVSIQMAARELRYQWFEEIRATNNYAFIATAHHLNDSVETVLLNLVRGTGISGLHGILEKRDTLIRPLIYTKRSEIEQYQKEHQLTFREDESNASTKYLRNKIRLEIIPKLKELNPDFEESFSALIEKAKETEEIVHSYINSLKEKHLQKEGNSIKIELSSFKKISTNTTVLFHFFAEFNFNLSTLIDLKNSIDLQSGKRFYSATHEILKDRDFIFLKPNDKDFVQSEIALLSPNEKSSLFFGIKWESSIMDATNYSISQDENTMSLDYDLLEFPLKVRHWQEGDKFKPLGMDQFKKLSDFFIDQKFSIHQKENTFVILTGSEIVWVVGQRIDNRFKITKNTKRIFQLNIKYEH